MPAVTLDVNSDSFAATFEQLEQLDGIDFAVLIDALSQRDRHDREGFQKSTEGSALQRHHAQRLKASRSVAEKLRRMAEA
jgi:hypothetical protein